MFMFDYLSQSGRLARPSYLFSKVIQLPLTGKFGRQRSIVIIQNVFGFSGRRKV